MRLDDRRNNTNAIGRLCARGCWDLSVRYAFLFGAVVDTSGGDVHRPNHMQLYTAFTSLDTLFQRRLSQPMSDGIEHAYASS